MQAGDRGGGQGQGTGLLFHPSQGDLAIAGKAILHRGGTQQAAQAFLHVKAPLERGAAQPVQALAVEQHLQAGLVSERQHRTAEGLRRDIERQHGGLSRGSWRLRIGRYGHGEQPQVNGQG